MRKRAKNVEFVPVEGFEEQYSRHLTAVAETEAQWKVVDSLAKKFDGKGSEHIQWPSYQKALADLEKLQQREFATWDGYTYAVKHRFDKIGVPEEELRAMINDSLKGSIDDDVQFNLPVGLVASKVAQAVRQFTSEESIGEPPLCKECKKEAAA